MTTTIRAQVTSKGITVHAEYSGGPYVELSYGYAGAPASHPLEVINVYDYATGTIDPRTATRKGVREIVAEWLADTTDPEQGGDPDALARYMANAAW